MWNEFYTKFSKANERKYILFISPRLTQLPLPMQRFDDPFLPFCKAIINASREFVSGYIFDFAAFLALGGAGGVALERTIDYVPDEMPTILHGAFSTLDYGAIADKTAFGVDAITISSYDLIQDYLMSSSVPAIVYHRQHNAIANGGVWHFPNNELSLYRDNVRLTSQVVGNEIIYASGMDNFAEVIHQRLAVLK